MEPQYTDITELKRLIEKNTKLVEENNELLRKLYRNGQWAFWTRVVWYLILIGLPFILYFYVLEPYFELVGANYEVFKAGVNEIPGLRGLEHLLEELGKRSY